MRVGEQVGVVQAFRHHGEGVDDRAQAGGAANAERTRHARRVAAFQVLRRCDRSGQREFAGGLAGHRGVRGEKNRNAGNAVVEVRAQADELENLGIAEPVETDPGGARSAANGGRGQFGGDPVGFGDENLAVGRSRAAFAAAIGSLSRRSPAPPIATTESGVLADDFDLPGDFRFIEALQPGPGARPGPEFAAVRIAMPAASPISWPSLGDTKCGTFNASRAERSARCNGQSGSESLSHSASLAMKSACADHIAPSSMVR